MNTSPPRPTPSRAASWLAIAALLAVASATLASVSDRPASVGAPSASEGSPVFGEDLSLALQAQIALAPRQISFTLAQADDDSATSLFEAFFIQKNPRTGRIEWIGSGIVWLLLAASATSLALIGVFAWENRRSNVAPLNMLKEARDLLAAGRGGSGARARARARAAPRSRPTAARTRRT